MTPRQIIDSIYLAGSPLRDIYMSHCQAVASLALEIARAKELPLDAGLVEDAAMLHDIGIYLTHAPSIECRGKEPYIRHGVLGAALLREKGMDERLARVAERHTGSGLTALEIEEQGLPLPHEDFLPESLLERLVCYADKFFSKSGEQTIKPLAKVRSQMARFGESSLSRFDALHREFAIALTCQ